MGFRGVYHSDLERVLQSDADKEMCTDVHLPRDPGCPSRPVNCKLVAIQGNGSGTEKKKSSESLFCESRSLVCVWGGT